MPKRRHIAIALVAATSAVTASAGIGPVAGASAATRFAAPGGGLSTPGGTPCTNAAKPCLLADALGEAVAGDDVQLASGSYFKSTEDPAATTLPFDNTLHIPGHVELHGANPAAPPVIHTKAIAAARTGIYVDPDGTIRDIVLKTTADDALPTAVSLLVDTNARVDRVRVEATGTPGTPQIACAIFDGATLRNSLCLGRGTATDGKVTAVTASSDTDIPTLRNVTAITTAASSPGLDILGTTAFITNSILRGTASDLAVRATQTGHSSTARLDHTNWGTQTTSDTSNATAKVIPLEGNQNGDTAATPKFIDAAAGDFRPLAGSPTIDAGITDDVKNGPLALGGTNRLLGTTTDMGAFEFQPPAVTPTPEPTTTPQATPGPAAPTPDPGASGGPGNTLQAQLRDTLAPQLTQLTIGRTVKRSKGTTITFSLSEPARVVLSFGQPKAGRSVGATCRRPTAKNRSQPRCTIPNVKGTLAVDGRAGANTVRFNGRIASGKRLAVGNYTLEATPTDAAGNRGLTSTRTVTLRR